jgi:hypothetical protein
VTPDAEALADVIARVVATLQRGGDDAAARARVAADVDALRATIAQAAPARAPLPGLDLAQLGEALRVFGEFLRAPTPASEVRAERAMQDLQLAIGPLVGWDPDREDREKREQYRREARAQLDEIFGDKSKKP